MSSSRWRVFLRPIRQDRTVEVTVDGDSGSERYTNAHAKACAENPGWEPSYLMCIRGPLVEGVNVRSDGDYGDANFEIQIFTSNIVGTRDHETMEKLVSAATGIEFHGRKRGDRRLSLVCTQAGRPPAATLGKLALEALASLRVESR